MVIEVRRLVAIMPLSPRGRRDYSPGARRSASPTRKGRSAYGESRAIFLGNISNDATYEDIAHLFSPYSDIANIGILLSIYC